MAILRSRTNSTKLAAQGRQHVAGNTETSGAKLAARDRRHETSETKLAARVERINISSETRLDAD